MTNERPIQWKTIERHIACVCERVWRAAMIIAHSTIPYSNPPEAAQSATVTHLGLLSGPIRYLEKHVRLSLLHRQSLCIKLNFCSGRLLLFDVCVSELLFPAVHRLLHSQFTGHVDAQDGWCAQIQLSLFQLRSISSDYFWHYQHKQSTVPCKTPRLCWTFTIWSKTHPNAIRI